MTSPSFRLLRRRTLASVATLLLAILAPIVLGIAPPQPLPTQRVDLRVLVVGNTLGTTLPWQVALRREGVPFDAKTANTINDGALADYGANRAKYQAVILTTGVPLPTPAQNALIKFEATFGIRQISDVGDEYNPAIYRGIDSITTFSDQSGLVGQLTDLGRQVFPYLRGSVQVEGPGAFGYQAVPTTTGSFQRLLNAPGGAAWLGIYTDPLDRRQEMVMTVSSNEFQLHNQLLRHGMLSWVTRGVYLGSQRNYFTMHVDDIFLPDAKWDPVTNTTPGDASVPTCELAGVPVNCPEVRMVPADVRATINWQNANSFRFELLYNAQGVQDARDAGAGVDPLTDHPTDGLLANKARFGWMNHTFTHAQLDAVNLATATSEINDNLAFATANALPNLNPAEIVTGEHSGLGSYQGVLPTGQPQNPAVVTAFNNAGIVWAGDDNSAKPNQRAIGNALTIPRYPSNVYYNVASREDQLDEYNHIYLPPPTGACVNSAVTTCRTTAATWADYVASESGIMFGHLMGNDPKPHYAHQSNLITDPVTGAGILFKTTTAAPAVEPGVLDALFTKYNTYFSVPLAQPTFAESGLLLQKQARWDDHVAAGRASAYLLDGKVHVVASQPLDVPLTGVNVGDLYGGRRSGWTSVGAGDTVFTPADPANTAPPTISGSTVVGNTLTATTGAWTGTSGPVAPITLNYQWQRCNGPVCVNITGVVDATYKTGMIDDGFQIRVVQMAGNAISSVSQAPSATVAIPGPPPPPGATPPTTPAPGNVPTVAPGTKLTMTNLTLSSRRFAPTKVRKGKVVGGTVISWRLNAIAKVTITVQRRKGTRWITLGTIQRDAKAGSSRYRFTGRLAAARGRSGTLTPGTYRFAVSARGRDAVKTAVQLRPFTLRKA